MCKKLTLLMVIVRMMRTTTNFSVMTGLLVVLVPRYCIDLVPPVVLVGKSWKQSSFAVMVDAGH